MLYSFLTFFLFSSKAYSLVPEFNALAFIRPVNYPSEVINRSKGWHKKLFFGKLDESKLPVNIKKNGDDEYTLSIDDEQLCVNDSYLVFCKDVKSEKKRNLFRLNKINNPLILKKFGLKADKEEEEFYTLQVADNSKCLGRDSYSWIKNMTCSDDDIDQILKFEYVTIKTIDELDDENDKEEETDNDNDDDKNLDESYEENNNKGNKNNTFNSYINKKFGSKSKFSKMLLRNR